MGKLTKTQQKRLVDDILSKTQKLWLEASKSRHIGMIVSIKDMEAIERLTAKWMKRIG
jgi:hypothetical protein